MSSPLSAPPERPRRRLASVPRFSKDPEVRSVQIGVVATLLFHVLLFFIMAMLLKPDFTSFTPHAKKKPETFDIDLAPEPEKEKPKPNNFVETNPDAPENVPDKTNNFGAQNQQAAQEKPAKDQHNDRPAIKGEKDVQSTQIVDGRLSKPNPPKESAPPVPVTPPVAPAAAAKREQNPLAGFEKSQGEDEKSFGSNIAKLAPSTDAAPEKIEGEKDAPLIQGATSQHIQIDPKRPMPRPELTRNVRPAIFKEQPIGTMNIGLNAYDARWSNYGQYLQRLIEAIQERWDKLISESKHYPQQGSTVTVTFVLNSEGKISSIRKVDGTADNLATNWCVSAISPNEGFSYGAWKEDMIAVLGTEQELTFTFLYR